MITLEKLLVNEYTQHNNMLILKTTLIDSDALNLLAIVKYS